MKTLLAVKNAILQIKHNETKPKAVSNRYQDKNY